MMVMKRASEDEARCEDVNVVVGWADVGAGGGTAASSLDNDDQMVGSDTAENRRFGGGDLNGMSQS
jgi:hypothetical protein